jgi:hypothetical protein
MSLVLQSSGGGQITIQEPTTASNFTANLPAATGTVVIGSSAVSAAGQIPFSTDGTTFTPIAKIVSATAVASTSGTSIDFTGIPSWVKRITVTFMGVGTSGNSIPIIQLGDSGGIETTSYSGTSGGSNAASGNSVSQMSVGFNLIDTGGASITLRGIVQICLGDSSTNTWCASGTLGNGLDTTCYWMGGSKSLSATLDRIRITTVNGTDTFDAGSINILYE